MNVNLVSDRLASISILRILAVIMLGYIVLGNVVALMVISLLYDGNLVEAMSNPQDHPDIRDSLLLAQGLASLVGLVLIPWYYLKFSEHRNIGRFFKAEEKWSILVLSLMIATIAFGIAISPITEWNANLQFPSWTGSLGEVLTNMEKQAEVLVKVFTSNLTPLTFSLVFLVVAILPAVGEELVFRGLIQTELQRAFGNPHAAIWAAAAFFSAFHFQFLGFFPRMLIGAFVGYLYFWSGNLWLPILAHFFNNGIQLIALYLNQKGIITMDVESTESAPLLAVLLSIAVAVALLYSIKRNISSRITST